MSLHLFQPPAPRTSLRDLDEKAVTTIAIGTKRHPGLARVFGWRCYHTLRSKGSEAGYPDWSLFRERHLYIELKTETGKVSDAQCEWLHAIVAAGVEAYVIRPRHLHLLEHVLRARSHGPSVGLSTREARDAQLELREELRKELS